MARFRNSVGFAECLLARYREDDVSSLGAQLTYYLILSFFPLLIFVVSVLGFAHQSANGLINDLVRILPTDTQPVVLDIFDEVSRNNSRALLSFGMLATIWAASSGVNAVIKGLNKAYDAEENRPYWKVKGISLLATLILAFVVVLSLFTLVFGERFGLYLFKLLHYPEPFLHIWGILKSLVPLSALFLVFLLLYRMAPNRKLTWKEVLPGTLFTTFGWIIASLSFSVYVNKFGHYSNTYGTLGGFIILLVWLYWTSIIILMGGEINATVAFRKNGVTKPPCKSFAQQAPWLKKLQRWF